MFGLETLLCWLCLSSLTVALVPPPPAPNTDPCGPFNHIGDAGFSTCMSPVVPPGPAPYGIVCGSDSGVTIPIKQAYCAQSANAMCFSLVTGRITPGQWYWTADTAQSPCRVGMFISSLEGAAPIPNFRRCLNQIYQPLVRSCVTRRHNIGTVNLQSLPDYTTNDTGVMVNPGYHAFIVSPVALFYAGGVTPGVWGDAEGKILWYFDPNQTLTDQAQLAYKAAHNVILPAATEGGRSTSSS